MALVPWLVFCIGTGFSSLAADTNLAPANGINYFDPAVLTGTIYVKAADPKEILFTFRRVATRSGGNINVLREFVDPDGKIAARERVQYQGNRLVSFELEELNSGASGTITVVRDLDKSTTGRQIVFTYSPDRNSPKKIDSENFQEDTLVNDMIAPYLSAHWGPLLKGSSVKFRLAVVARRETVGFKLVKESETTWQGIPVMMVRMEPTSWVIARLVDPLHFTVEKAPPHRVLQYVGRTTPRIQKGTKWTDLDVVSIYDWH